MNPDETTQAAIWKAWMDSSLDNDSLSEDAFREGWNECLKRLAETAGQVPDDKALFDLAVAEDCADSRSESAAFKHGYRKGAERTATPLLARIAELEAELAKR